ncbi:MAG TPA: hypothetical protein VGN90_09100 [Pyrinomonadaceae bacterium]|jgi:hypothetical protein|nr:hypothetical protein [Pyrinomonadaceae bacterium]
MNFDGDYLWDKSGEPDPEVQQLEEILGGLRYQPRPLEIPAELQVDRERSFFRAPGPRLAIAATIAMLLLGLGVWLGLQRLHRTEPAQATGTPKAPGVKNDVAPVPSTNEDANPTVAVSPKFDQKPDQKFSTPHRRVTTPAMAKNSNRLRNQPEQNPELASNEQEAKDQLMLALRLASTKLNLAQKKIQNINSRELMHNQHKIG